MCRERALYSPPRSPTVCACLLTFRVALGFTRVAPLSANTLMTARGCAHAVSHVLSASFVCVGCVHDHVCALVVWLSPPADQTLISGPDPLSGACVFG